MKHARDLKKKLQEQAKRSGQELDINKQIEAIKKEKDELEKIKAYNKQVEEVGKLRHEVNHPILHRIGNNVKNAMKSAKKKNKLGLNTPKNPFLKEPNNPFR